MPSARAPEAPAVVGLAPVDMPVAVAAVERAAAAVVADVAAAGRLDRPVPGLTWTAAQVVAHLRVQLERFADFATGARTPEHDLRPDDGGPAVAARVAQVNERLLREAVELEPRAAASALQARAAALTSCLRAADPDAEFASWEAVTDVRTGCLTALTELLVHGWDLRRSGLRRASRPDPALSALAWHAVLRLMPVFVDRARLPRRPVAVRIAVAGGPVAVVVTGDRGGTAPVVVTTAAPPVPVHATLSGNASVLLLLATGRLSLVRAAATARIRVDGRRPLDAVAMHGWFHKP